MTGRRILLASGLALPALPPHHPRDYLRRVRTRAGDDAAQRIEDDALHGVNDLVRQVAEAGPRG